MNIISAYQDTPSGHQDIDINTITPDEREKIETEHNIARLKHPTWAFFGGVVHIDNRHYQVV